MSEKRNSTFCVLPWIHLATHPHGGVGLCCESDHRGAENMARNFDGPESSEANRKFLNLTTDSIESVLNSDYFKRVRLQMLAGEAPPACVPCYEKEKKGIDSKRLREGRVYNLTQKRAQVLTGKDGSIEPDIRFIELRLGNTCNLKCRSCNPGSSSKWKADYAKLEESLSFVTSYKGFDDFSWPERKEFWDELQELTKSLVWIYINGGEPMLNRRHFDFLAELARTGRSRNVSLLYSSNMTGIPDRAIEIWKSFKHVQVNASVDDLAERNRYIRYPADWNVVEASLDKLRDNRIGVAVLQTVSAMNLFYLDEYNAWAYRRGFQVIHNFVFDPPYLSPNALPEKVRRAILEKLAKKLPASQMGPLNSLFLGPDQPELWSQFKSYTRKLDELRGESFEKTFPELADFLKEAGHHT